MMTKTSDTESQPSRRSLRGLTRGTGNYNVDLGLVNAAYMAGFFLSQTTAGLVVDMTQTYSGGFLCLASIAVPETLNRNARARPAVGAPAPAPVPA